MKFLLGVDYELFFGLPTGTPEACMLEPTQALVEVLERHGARLTVFVDVGYLLALAGCPNPRSQKEHSAVANQLEQLAAAGHDVQLHIHPHWQDSERRNECWRIDTQRYKLQDFECTEISEIVERYSAHLAGISGVRPIAYRAGGWCLQPFSKIAAALHRSGVIVDSTVYAGGRSANPGREFDFRGAPAADWWRFDDDPLKPQDSGRFVELPISTVSVSPLFYWRMLYRRFRPSEQDRRFGNGAALKGSGAYYLRKLLAYEHGVASIDGARAGLLEQAYRRARRSGANVLNVMGHPKALSKRSLLQLDRFLEKYRTELSFHTPSSLLPLLNNS